MTLSCQIRGWTWPLPGKLCQVIVTYNMNREGVRRQFLTCVQRNMEALNPWLSFDMLHPKLWSNSLLFIISPIFYSSMLVTFPFKQIISRVSDVHDSIYLPNSSRFNVNISLIDLMSYVVYLRKDISMYFLLVIISLCCPDWP